MTSTSLPHLIVNRSFMSEFVRAKTPCVALGLVEVQNQECAFIALRPDQPISSDISDQGLRFGHCLLGTENYEVIHFSFEFYGFATYNVLINPNNSLMKVVLKKIIEDGDCFFFALDTTGNVTAFRTEIDSDILTSLKSNLSRLMNSTTTDTQYRQAVSSFSQNPNPQGIFLNWVCRNEISYLDLTHDRLELTPV
jgi:hypothetical protein